MTMDAGSEPGLLSHGSVSGQTCIFPLFVRSSYSDGRGQVLGWNYGFGQGMTAHSRAGHIFCIIVTYLDWTEASRS